MDNRSIRDLFFALVAVALVGCANDSTPQQPEGATTDQSSPAQSSLTADSVLDVVSDQPEHRMSSTCSVPMHAQQLWDAVNSGAYDLFMVRGIEVLADEEVREQTSMGVLESRALRISLKSAYDWVTLTEEHPDFALLFVEDSRVLHSNTGEVYREQACDRAGSVEASGSLSSRTMAGNGRSVALVVQRTAQLGAVVRQVIPVVGDSLRLAEGEELSLLAVREAAASVRAAISDQGGENQ